MSAILNQKRQRKKILEWILPALLVSLSTFFIGCSDNFENDPDDNPSMLDSSFVEINTDSGILFTTRFHPCEALGSASTWINHPDTSLYQPIVVMPWPFDLNSDF